METEAEAEADPLYLPHELIVQILVRLPVKPLIRFKCVSKSWFFLISNPRFANSHFQITTATHTRRILFLTETPEFRSIALDSLFTDHSAPTLLNPNFMLHKLVDLKILGSCRGFMFLYSSSNFYLWNPSTGVHKQIPCSNFSHLRFYGFGYDESTDDYLVVSLSYDNIQNSNDMLSRLGIFSLRANAWNEIVSPTNLRSCRKAPFSRYPEVESVFNGAIHWLASSYDIGFFAVVAFHLTERKLVDFSLPYDINYRSRYCGLWVFKGFLSLWILGSSSVDIWVMEEYNVQSSWTKSLVLNMDIPCIPCIFPMCCTKNGDVVGTDRHTGLIRYDDEGEFLEHTYYCKGSGRGRVSIYTESLLSLPSVSVGEQD